MYKRKTCRATADHGGLSFKRTVRNSDGYGPTFPGGAHVAMLATLLQFDTGLID